MPERNGRARSETIRDSMRAMEGDWKAVADATAAIEQFNVRLGAGNVPLSWPTIASALVSKHHWLIVACDSCGTVIDLDPVSYTHLRAHETGRNLVCRL